MPLSLAIHHDRCPLCKGVATPYLLDTRDLHYGIIGSWNYHRCLDCKVVFLNPAPTEAFLKNAYDDSYYSYQQFGTIKRWQIWARRFIGYSPGVTRDPRFTKPGRVLDIGCGSGEFLYKMKMAGWETHGVELGAKAAEIGNRFYALNIQAGTLVTAKFPEGYFDYVRLNHSFEHLVNPHETIELIRKYLSTSGLLFIGVPNIESIQSRVFRKCWWNLGPPVHPFGYSFYTLSWLLKQHGFEVVTARTNSNFAGILGSLQMKLNYSRGIYSDSGRLHRNLPAKLISQWLAKLLDLFKQGDCLEVIARKV